MLTSLEYALVVPHFFLKIQMEVPPAEKIFNGTDDTPEIRGFDPKEFAPGDKHALLFIGMAGTGKSSLYHRLNSYLSQHKMKKLLLNLDPATLKTKANIDIRDTVDYQKVMEEYKLGPNGGIMTCLNLFATKFDQVLDIVEERKGFVLIDTPGQIELFTWSASGAIIAETLRNTLCTTILYVVDTVKCQDPVTFMSNMMYAVSILYKLKLPFLLVFNKVCISDDRLMWQIIVTASSGCKIMRHFNKWLKTKLTCLR